MSALDIALQLAASGLPVFPCGRSKRPCISKAEGGHGFHDASTDPDEVRRLFGHRGAALVAVPTGEQSGFDVLDLDYRSGAAGWEQDNLHRLPETRIHQTQSGGRHMLFTHAPGVRNSASRDALAPGVDVRGEGGYIVAPPSAGYSVVSDAPIAHWPDWLLPLVLPTPPRQAPARSADTTPVSVKRLEAIIQSVLKRVSSAGPGQKHFQLRNAALLIGGIADRAGLSDAAAIRRLIGALPADVKDWKVANATAAWGLEMGRKRPLELTDRERPPPDPRRRETAKQAFRLLKLGVPSAAIVAALAEQNKSRPDPLPDHVIGETALWATKTFKDAPHA